MLCLQWYAAGALPDDCFFGRVAHMHTPFGFLQVMLLVVGALHTSGLIQLVY